MSKSTARFSNPFEIPKDVPGLGMKKRGKKTGSRGLALRTETLRPNSPTLDRAGKILYGK